MTPFRSLLNVPANRPSMVEKAPGYGADALILDLEDAVPPDQKAEAREPTRAAIERYAALGVVTLVRVNGIETGHLEADLEAVVRPGLAGIQVPKVNDAATVREIDRRLAALEAARGLAVGTVELLVSLETAAGVLHAFDVLSAATRIGSVMLGTAEHGDLHGELGYVRTDSEHEIAYLRAHVLLAARAAGVAHPIDGVYADYRNLDGLRATALRAREIGYRGKKVIHPAQVPVVNEVFAATPAELDRYRRIVEAYEAAAARGEGTSVVDGRMIDVAMAETARRVLAREAEVQR